MKNLKKNLLVIVLIFIFTVININSINYAVVEVTKGALNTSLQKYIASEDNENKYLISVEESVIKIVTDGKTYNLNYDLKGEPTFRVEIPIKKGMSYEEFKESNECSNLPMIGYAAVCDVQGVSYEDSLSNYLFSCLGSAFNQEQPKETNTYMIIDDLNVEEGVTLQKDNDSNAIYTSEFKDRVMEYVDSLYSKKVTTSDSNSFNTFSMTIDKVDETDTSCKIISELTVNLNGDFDKMKGYADSLSDTIKDSIKIEEEQSENSDKENDETINNTTETQKSISSEEKSNVENTNSEPIVEENKEVKEETKNEIKEIPNAGIDNKLKNIVMVIILLSVLTLIAINIKNNNE